MTISVKEKLAYGCGDFANGLIFNAVTIYLMFFYTEKLGLSAASASLLLLLARFWDALIDPIMGVIADRTHSRFGRYRPYLLFAPVPLAIVAVLTYLVPDTTSSIKLVWAYLTYFLLMACYTAVNIPYAALPAVMSSDPVTRIELTSYRMSGSFISGIIVNMSLFPLIEWFTDNIEQNTNAYAMGIAVIALISLAGFWLCFSGVRERVAAHPKPVALKENFQAVLKTPAWWFLLALGLTMFSFNIFIYYSGLYYLKYIVGDESLAPVFFTAGTMGMLSGSLANLVLVKHVNKRHIARTACMLSAIASMLLFFSGENAGVTLYVLAFLSLFSVGVCAPVLWALVTDTADAIELHQQKHVAALTSSALSFSMKAGMGIGGALVGIILTMSGFEANQTQNTSTLTAMSVMVGIIPAAGNIVFMLLLTAFPISIQQETDHQQQLAERRAALIA